MGARYVWEKYTLNKRFVSSDVPYNQYLYGKETGGPADVGPGSRMGYYGTGITQVKDNNGILSSITLENPKVMPSQTERSVFSDGQYFRYFSWVKKDGITEYIDAYTQSGSWYSYGSGKNAVIYVIPDSGASDYVLPLKKYTLEGEKGNFISDISSSSKSAYPTDSDGGEVTGYWYTYKGSDSIDPSAITYPAEDLESGQQIIVSVIPSSSNTYGGTVTYLYQYKRNDGSWADLKTTTDTSASYTIPEGTANIQFRVRASDNMGFTSTDYITGQNAAVSQLKVYIGINGKAHRVNKLYVGINGKARQVVKGYIGVNGKARRFL